MQTHELNPTSAVAHLEIQPNGVGLELLAVSRLYGSRAALDRCRFRCKPGEFVAVVGKSGSGKSTLLRLLAGLERATSGQILQDGSPIDGINRSARVMFQEPRLLPWKRVEQNAALGLDANGKARARELLVKVGLDGREGDWPTILSGGQKQRVALARALAGRPRLLLLDEPLGALDALNRYAMQDLIERLWLDLRPTALLVTHDPEEAVLLGDRVIVLDEGKVVKDMVVDLPRPRDRDSSDLRAFRRELLDVLLS